MPMVNPNPTQSSLSIGTCISSSRAMVEVLPPSPSRSTWFTQDDVNTLKEDGINVARIPVSAIASPIGSYG